MYLPHPAVEHIQPKSRYPELCNTWDNFLLACTSCNSTKDDEDINADNLTNYFWPDLDNTFKAFLYDKDRAPQINPGLNPLQQQIARNTLELTGLDREPGHPSLTNRDRRWIKRKEAWKKSEEAANRLANHNNEAMREQIVETARSTGFWSVWMTVFADDHDMRRRFIAAFAGTCAGCFDQNTHAVPRAGGQI